MESPVHHFELHRILPIELFGFDLSINKAVIMMWLVVAAVALFFIVGGRRRQLVPSKFQSIAEYAVVFIRQMALDTMGQAGLVFVPFLTALFFFILFCNLFGLVPGSYTVTSQVMVTGVFALIVFAMSMVIGFRYHGPGYFVKVFAPPAIEVKSRGIVYAVLFPLIVVFQTVLVGIEIISFLARPITLAVRLFANMTAGHMVLSVFFGLMIMGGIWIGWFPFVFTVPLYALELLVAFIQAYVFVVLTSVYFSQAIHLH